MKIIGVLNNMGKVEKVELVIKLPAKLYDLIQSKIEFNGDLKQKDIKTIMIAIDDGVLLPKGHGSLKDTDKIISGICGSSCGCRLEECGHDTPCYSVTRISSGSTIIEADKGESEE